VPIISCPCALLLVSCDISLVLLLQTAAASAISNGSFLARVGGRSLQGICAALPSSGSAAGCMAAAAGLLVAALAVALVQQRLRKLEASFLTGTWPPPRNA
jgi:hypothetical protein